MSNYPGYGATLTNDPTAILASGHGYIIQNVTIKTGEGELDKGTVLGIETTSEKYVVYDDGETDGSEVAQAILADDVDATSSDQLVAVYLRGLFLLSKLTGYDAAALADLNGRRIGKVGGATTDTILV